MGAGGGAVVAIMVAAREKRIQEVVDAFRLGDATTPDRARRLEELGIGHYDEANHLAAKGVLAPGRREGTYYLDEAMYIALREGRKGRVALVIVAVVLVLFGLLVLMRVVTRQ
jgi:hypothetical protein